MKFIHPLWTHVPAVLALLAGAIFTWRALPLPDPAPVHFTIGGQPDRYGSPWTDALWMGGLSLLYIVLSVMWDEGWARQEKRKSFNWMSLVDDVTIAALATVQVTYVHMLTSLRFVYVFPWLSVFVVSGLAAVAAIAIEKLRPFRPCYTGSTAEDVDLVRKEVLGVLTTGRPLVYWEAQDPVYFRVLAVAVPVLLVGVAVAGWAGTPWVSLPVALSGVALALTYGGFRTAVTRDAITVRMGILGLRLLRLKVADIISAELHSFAPLKDFGGYGIRFNRHMKAYFLRGDRGVKVTTRAGKQYLIGSDHPETLAAVIGAVVS